MITILIADNASENDFEPTHVCGPLASAHQIQHPRARGYEWDQLRYQREQQRGEGVRRAQVRFVFILILF